MFKIVASKKLPSFFQTDLKLKPRAIKRLPNPIWTQVVFSHLRIGDILNMSEVCKDGYILTSHASVWQLRCKHDFGMKIGLDLQAKDAKAIYKVTYSDFVQKIKETSEEDLLKQINSGIYTRGQLLICADIFPNNASIIKAVIANPALTLSDTISLLFQYKDPNYVPNSEMLNPYTDICDQLVTSFDLNLQKNGQRLIHTTQYIINLAPSKISSDQDKILYQALLKGFLESARTGLIALDTKDLIDLILFVFNTDNPLVVDIFFNFIGTEETKQRNRGGILFKPDQYIKLAETAINMPAVSKKVRLHLLDLGKHSKSLKLNQALQIWFGKTYSIDKNPLFELIPPYVEDEQTAKQKNNWINFWLRRSKSLIIEPQLEGRSPFQIAGEWNHEVFFHFLCVLPPNELSKEFLLAKDQSQNTLLHLYCKRGNYNVVRYMLGALPIDVSISEENASQQTALDLAKQIPDKSARTEIVKRLKSELKQRQQHAKQLKKASKKKLKAMKKAAMEKSKKEKERQKQEDKRLNKLAKKQQKANKKKVSQLKKKSSRSHFSSFMLSEGVVSFHKQRIVRKNHTPPRQTLCNLMRLFHSLNLCSLNSTPTINLDKFEQSNSPKPQNLQEAVIRRLSGRLSADDFSLSYKSFSTGKPDETLALIEIFKTAALIDNTQNFQGELVHLVKKINLKQLPNATFRTLVQLDVLKDRQKSKDTNDPSSLNLHMTTFGQAKQTNLHNPFASKTLLPAIKKAICDLDGFDLLRFISFALQPVAIPPFKLAIHQLVKKSDILELSKEFGESQNSKGKLIRDFLIQS